MFSLTRPPTRGELAEGLISPSLRKGWALKKLDLPRLTHFLNTQQAPVIGDDSTAELVAENLAQYLASACDASMPPRVATTNRRKPVHWWSDAISELRKKCIKTRRAYTRARRRDPVLSEALILDFRATRRALAAAIRAARDKSWRQLCEAVEQDPWGSSLQDSDQEMGNPSSRRGS